MDLIINKVMEFEVIHYADRNGVIEFSARSAVVKSGLAGFVESEYLLGVEFEVFGIVFKFAGLLGKLLGSLGSGLEIGLRLGENLFVCLIDGIRYIAFVSAVENGSHNIDSETARGKSEVNLKNLTDIHTRGNAERVKTYIERCAVGKEGHIRYREDSRNNALVTVAARHLVAD